MKTLIYCIIFGTISLTACKDSEKVKPNCIDLELSTSDNHPSCKASNGSITINATPSEEDLEYSLDGINFQESKVFPNLSAGEYTITVRNSSNCIQTTSVTLVDTSTIQVTYSFTNSGCGESNGTLSVVPTGGSGVFSYSLDGGVFQTSPNFTGLESRNYRLTVQDENGCDKVETVRIQSGISYQAEVKTIIATNCAKSGCHVQGGQSPNLTLFSNIQANAARIKALTANKSMPKDGSLSAAEIQKIACWVDDGALDN